MTEKLHTNTEEIKDLANKGFAFLHKVNEGQWTVNKSVEVYPKTCRILFIQTNEVLKYKSGELESVLRTYGHIKIVNNSQKKDT